MHGIRFVDDDELPDGHDFMLVSTDSWVLIFYRRSALTPQNLEDSWAAFRALRTQRPPGRQARRREDARHLAAVDTRRLA